MLICDPYSSNSLIVSLPVLTTDNEEEQERGHCQKGERRVGGGGGGGGGAITFPVAWLGMDGHHITWILIHLIESIPTTHARLRLDAGVTALRTASQVHARPQHVSHPCSNDMRNYASAADMDGPLASAFLIGADTLA